MLNLREVTLAGHSMGGAIAMHYAASPRKGRGAKLALFGAATAAGIKGSKLIRFEHSGHGLFYEEQEKFNKELMDFIG